MKKHRKGNKKPSGLALLFIGALISATMFALLSFIFALLAYRTNDPTSLTDVFSLISLLLTGAVMGFAVSKIKGDGGMLISVLCALLFCVCLLMVGVIMSGGSLPPRVPLNYVCYLGVASLFAWLGGRKKKRGRIKGI